MIINDMIDVTYPLGKGEVVSSILPGSTIKRALRKRRAGLAVLSRSTSSGRWPNCPDPKRALLFG